MRIAQLRILEKIRPGNLKLIAQKMQIVPGFLFLILLIFHDDDARRTAKARSQPAKRQQAARDRAEKHDNNRQINERIQRENAFHQRQKLHVCFPPLRVFFPRFLLVL